MPNTNSANRRRRRAELLLGNSLLRTHLQKAKNGREKSRSFWRRTVINQVRNTWPKNLVPFLNATLMNRLYVAYNNIKPELNKRARAKTIANEAVSYIHKRNAKRRANQHAAFLLTNEGKQWKRKNTERKRLEEQRLVEQARRRNQANRWAWEAGGITGYNIGGW